MKKGKNKVRKVLLIVLLLIVAGGIYFYAALPAINIHNMQMWLFLLVAVIAIAALLPGKYKGNFSNVRNFKELKEAGRGFQGIKWKVGLGAVGAILLVLIVGSILSSPIVNSKKYYNLMKPDKRDFTKDIDQVSLDQIPLLDRDSATLLGDRAMGSMVDMVSQFEISDLYSQINVGGEPVRVSPLTYASTIKWFTNQSDGIPAYVKVDMQNQDAEIVKLDKPIKYSQAEHLNRNIDRHLRFKYPTYMFDQLSFEIDEHGVPFWICPVKDYTIGLFGGQTIRRVVLCNAQTGETTDYAVKDCPQWVDRVFPADLLTQLYNYHGSLGDGYFNSVLGQKGCLKTTEGYNYIAMDDDVWMYTGVTSVNADESNVGFILVNQRTMESRYYEIPGAKEYAAMSSAEGQVQHLGYTATFPLLLNISNEPTYVMALKDKEGLVKMYAMVNVQKYQSVAVGESITGCRDSYVKLLGSSGGEAGADKQEKLEVTGKIARIAQSVIDGNSHFYITLEDNDAIFDVAVTDFVGIVGYDVGDTIKFEYEAGDPLSTVTKIE